MTTPRSEPEIDALLDETRVFPPPEAWRERAQVTDPGVYERAARNPEAFWEGFAKELEWMQPWSAVLDWKPPHAKWFVGGRLNVSVNCLDRHVRSAHRNKAAIVWEGEPGDRRTLTYFDLHQQVCQFANVLKSLGVRKGDRVALYLPLIPELAMAMLACARIGAVHSVVFGGFSAEALRDRINDAQATLLVTADGGYRRGHIVPLKQMADEALRDTPSIRNVVVVQRNTGQPLPMHFKDGRDHWYHALMEDASTECPAEPMDAEDMLYILYTSGTTGKPKGIVHTTGGLPGRHVRDDEVGVRSARGRFVLVHGRHRLGHRPQLRRVRTARQWCERAHVRRRARLAAEGSVLAIDRAARRHHLLHRANGHPRVHEMGRQLAGGARSQQPPSARIGWRADQSRSLDVVPRTHRP